MAQMTQVRGQTRALDTLQAALASERLHHAFIFHGPQGVGKFTAARWLAQQLLCHEPARDLAGQLEACGSCASCRLLRGEEHTHPDLHVVRKEMALHSAVAALKNRKLLSIPVDLLREHVVGGTTSDGKFHDAPVSQASVLRHNKVFIIDEAELMNAAGQNALLKTLEEPPAGTYLILVTSSEDQLLPTIRSRCLRVGFAPLSDAMVMELLGALGREVPAGAEQALLDFAGGSVGRALLALQFDLLNWGQLWDSGLTQMLAGKYPAQLGTATAQELDRFAGAWVGDNDNASKEAANKHAVRLMWSLIGQMLRRRLREAGTTAGSDVNIAETAVEPWLRAIDALPATESEIRANVNLALVCDHLVSLIARALAPAQPVAAGRR